MKKSVSLILQEGDDYLRMQLEKQLQPEKRFLRVTTYKTLHSLLACKQFPFNSLVLVNWHHSIDFFLFLKKINAASKSITVVVTFDFFQPDFIYDVMMQGASGFLLKPFTVGDVLSVYSNAANKKLQYHLHVLQRSGYGNHTAAAGS